MPANAQQIKGTKKPKPCRYISKLSEPDQQVRLILQILNRDEKRAKPELKSHDHYLLIMLASDIALGN